MDDNILWKSRGANRMWYIGEGEVYQYIADCCMIQNQDHVCMMIRARDSGVCYISVVRFEQMYREATLEEVRHACERNPKLAKEIAMRKSLSKIIV
jgi:hypothetical protein